MIFPMKRTLSVVVAILFAGVSPAFDVFTMPQIQPRHQMLVREFENALRAGDAAAMEAVARQGAALLPEDATWRYNLACALSLQGKSDESLDVLERSIRLGFHDAEAISNDSDLSAIHAKPRFDELLELAKSLAAEGPKNPVGPFRVKGQKAWVGATNTVWNYQLGIFDVFFDCSGEGLPAVTNPVVKVKGPAGDAVRKWFAEGTAAGNRGDIYDNRDADHSRLDLPKFPWMAGTRYREEAKRQNVDRSMEAILLFHGPKAVVGNASNAYTQGPFWRSNARRLMMDPGLMSMLFYTYFRNQIYVFPALWDFDATREGDVYPANMPYVLNSVGASWSDKPFLEAFSLSLAAMRPEVKEFLSQGGLIAPTLQWAFRASQGCVTNREDYLSAAAHPPAFQKDSVRTLRMVTLCHDLTTNSLPPIAMLDVVEEDLPRFDPDRVDHEQKPEILFTTPQSIARVWRLPGYRRRMVVSAEGSRELGGKPLRWHWKLFRGDPSKVSIRPLDERGSRAEIVIEYQSRAPVAPGSDMLGSRVEIGVFADNGDFLSVPAFLSYLFPANEVRAYSADGLLLTMDGVTGAKFYADPALFPIRRWLDVYRYDGSKLVGWTRHVDGRKERFAWNGAKIETTDSLGRALTARSVSYRVDSVDTAPELKEEDGPARIRWTFAYDGDDDSIGHIVKRERIP